MGKFAAYKKRMYTYYVRVGQCTWNTIVISIQYLQSGNKKHKKRKWKGYIKDVKYTLGTAKYFLLYSLQYFATYTVDPKYALAILI